MDAAVNCIFTRLRRGEGSRIATVNLDFLARARTDETLRTDLDASTLVVADGAPVVWLARLQGARQVRRVAGVDLVRELCRAGAAESLRVALYGSTEDLAAAAAEHLEQTYPGVRVVARVSPPFRPLSTAEHRELLEPLVQAQPGLVLVALGCPRQERIIAEFSGLLPWAAWIGIGGTFDFYAGKRRRAPRFVQRLGLEWLVRLAQDPRRLWRRYLVDDLPELARLAPGGLRTWLTAGR
jgi:N-acetylglucosaminyldiphosphoundecaprenol N-acetyl-beta-D-mannosaminyltransferase